MTEPHASSLVQFGIPGLALAVAALFVAGAAAVGRTPRTAVLAALGVAASFAVSGALAASGALADVTRRPPVFPLLLVATPAITVVVSRSTLGRRLAEVLPLWALVGAQAFRLPLELVMHRAVGDGVMTVDMSFEGYNFDIVTGATALVLGVVLYLRPVPRGVLLAWNVMGSVL